MGSTGGRTPKGLRHGYGMLAIGTGVPLNMLSKWIGHATIEVTAIHPAAMGTGRALKLRAAHHSPCYATRLGELPVARAR